MSIGLEDDAGQFRQEIARGDVRAVRPSGDRSFRSGRSVGSGRRRDLSASTTTSSSVSASLTAAASRCCDSQASRPLRGSCSLAGVVDLGRLRIELAGRSLARRILRRQRLVSSVGRPRQANRCPGAKRRSRPCSCDDPLGVAVVGQRRLDRQLGLVDETRLEFGHAVHLPGSVSRSSSTSSATRSFSSAASACSR